MDPVLSFVYEDDFGLEEDEAKEVNIWSQNKNVFTPATSVKFSDKLTPGNYIVEYSRDIGAFCKKQESRLDELYIFEDSIINNLFNEISAFWENSKVYSDNKLIHKRGILLEGPAGTGKSSLINILSDKLIKKGGIVFRVENNLPTYINFITNSFRIIEKNTPFITIIEDIDQYSEDESVLLDFLDGHSSMEHHIIIATTNKPKELPITLLRPSRLDTQVEISFPTEDIRKIYLKNKGISENLIDKLAKDSEGLSLADLKEICICINVFGYSAEVSIEKLRNPSAKKNYMRKNRGKISL